MRILPRFVSFWSGKHIPNLVLDPEKFQGPGPTAGPDSGHLSNLILGRVLRAAHEHKMASTIQLTRSSYRLFDNRPHLELHSWAARHAPAPGKDSTICTHYRFPYW